MKRTNPEKGLEVDPGWVEITWDEALDTAAEKIRECYDTDIRKLVQMYSFAPYESGHATLGIGLWAMALGTPNSSSTKGQMCIRDSIYVQLVDDVASKTICGVSTLGAEFKATGKKGGTVEGAAALGEIVGRCV